MARSSSKKRGGMVEEVVHRARRDPRAEPDGGTMPPPRELASAPIEDAPSVPPEPRQSDPPEAPAPIATLPPASSTAQDPRFVDLEPLLGQNAWREVVALLDPEDAVRESGVHPATLPPGLALVLALAKREIAGDASAADANALAITSMADLLGVSPKSHTALLLAKRLLRQPPASWRTKPAPSARYTVPIVLLALVLGLAAGWFVKLGPLSSLHLF